MVDTINAYDYERIDNVDLSLLDSGPYSVRETADEEKLRSLANSIKQRGVQDAIAVAKKQDGRFEVIYGNRRVAASKIAQLKEIRAKIFPSDLPIDERELMSCTENWHREDLTEVEMANLIDRIVTSSGDSKQKAAQRLGCTVREINQWLSFKVAHYYMPGAKAKDVPTVDLIKRKFDKSLWTEMWKQVQHLHRDDAREAIEKIAQGGKPDDVLKELIERPTKEKGGWHVQARIYDPIVNRAIDSAAGIDGLSKADFLVECAKKEVIRRGFYRQAQEAYEGMAQEQTTAV